MVNNGVDSLQDAISASRGCPVGLPFRNLARSEIPINGTRAFMLTGIAKNDRRAQRSKVLPGSILVEIAAFVCLARRLIELVARVPLRISSQVRAERHITRNLR